MWLSLLTRTDTAGALRPPSLPAVTPEQFGVLRPDLLRSEATRPPNAPVLASPCPRHIPAQRRSRPDLSPGQGPASRPTGHCHRLPEAICGHCPSQAMHPLHPRRAQNPREHHPWVHQRSHHRAPAPKRDGNSRLRGGEGTNLGTENSDTKFREERKQETWCTVIPESQPPPQRSHGMLRQPELASGPAPHPAAAGPPPPSQPGAAPECK